MSDDAEAWPLSKGRRELISKLVGTLLQSNMGEGPVSGKTPVSDDEILHQEIVHILHADDQIPVAESAFNSVMRAYARSAQPGPRAEQ